MTTRIQLALVSTEERCIPMGIDAHHMFADGQMNDTPTWTRHLYEGSPAYLTIHSRLGLVISKGQRATAQVFVSNRERSPAHALDVAVLAVAGADDVAATLEAEGPVEFERLRIPAGESATIVLTRASVLVIREVPIEAEQR